MIKISEVIVQLRAVQLPGLRPSVILAASHVAQVLLMLLFLLFEAMRPAGAAVFTMREFVSCAAAGKLVTLCHGGSFQWSVGQVLQGHSTSISGKIHIPANLFSGHGNPDVQAFELDGQTVLGLIDLNPKVL